MPASGGGNTRARQLKKKQRKSPIPHAGPTNSAKSYVSQGKAVEKVANRQKAAKRKRRQPTSAPYVSQGKAVEKRATQLTRQTKRQESAKGHRINSDKLVRILTPLVPRGKKVKGGHPNIGASIPVPNVGTSLVGLQTKAGRRNAAANLAPVTDQLVRTNHMVMGAAREEVKQIKKKGLLRNALSFKPNKRNIHEAVKGFKNQTHYTGSDVLKEAGVKNKIVRAAGGLALDFTLDPIVGAKFSRLAPKEALEREAARATVDARKAAKTRKIKGVTVKRAKPGRAAALNKRAAKLTEKSKTASTTRGIQAGYDAKVPFGPRVTGMTSGKTTAKAGKRLAPAGRRAHDSGAAKTVSAMFNPTARKVGETREEAAKFTYAERQRRAGEHEAKRYGQRRATAHARATKKVDNPSMIAAVEGAAKHPMLDTKLIRPSRKRRVGAKGNEKIRVDAKTNKTYAEFKATAPKQTIAELPPKARAVAETTREEFRRLGAEQVNAKVLATRREDYYRHRAIPTKGRGAKRKGRPSNTSQALRRTDERPIFEQEAERAAKGHPPVFSTDHPTVMGSYTTSAKEAIVDAKFLGDVKKAGKPLNRANYKTMRDTDGLYEITPTGIKSVIGKHGKELTHDEAIERIGKAERKGGDTGLTILPKDRAASVQRGNPGSGATTESREAWHRLNKPMSAFKTAATVLNAPFYQLRNIVDDSYRAWTGDTPGHAFPKAASLVKDQALLERRQTNKLIAKPIEGTVELGGKTLPKKIVARWAMEDGAMRSGFASGSDMLEGSAKPASGIHRFQPVKKVRQYSQNLEDTPRLAAYLGGLDRGMTRQQASAHMRAYMFDYDELTDTERAVRGLLIPFYTYAKNNTLLHARLLVSRPGKPAAIMKLREAANSYGSDSDKYRAQVKTVMPLLKEAEKQGLLDAKDIQNLKSGDFARLLSETDQRGYPFMGPDGKLQFMPLGITDLNRIPLATSYEALKNLPRTQWDLAMSMVGPQKLPAEVMQNYSYFFKSAIFRDAKNPYAEKWTAAPAWAAKAGLTTNRTIDGKTTPAWTTKTDYMVRSFGPQAGLLANLGNPVKNARGQTTKDLIRKQLTGVRAADVDDRILTGIMEKAIRRTGDIDVELQNLGDVPNDKGRTTDGVYPTKRFHALGQEKKDLKALIDHIKTQRGTYVAPKTTLRPPPLSPHDEIQKKLRDLKARDPQAEIQRKLKVMRAKRDYLRNNP